MAEGLFLVERTLRPDNNVRDGIQAVIINNDDGDTDAQHIAAAILAVNTALPSTAEDKLPAGYFDTVNELSDLVTTGDLRTALDFLCFTREVTSVRT